MTQATAEQLRLARECAAEVWISKNEHAAIHMLRDGQCDHYREVQSALLAIKATEARCAEMLENKAQAMLNIDPDGAQEVAEALIMAARSIRSQSNG